MDSGLLKAFSKLHACHFRRGRFDFRCPSWRQLKARLTRPEVPGNGGKLRTLQHLLSRDSERIRLVAAQALAAFGQRPVVRKALMERFELERSRAVRRWIVAALDPRDKVARAFLLRILKSSGSLPVRLQAAEGLVSSPATAREGIAKALMAVTGPANPLGLRQQALLLLGGLSGSGGVEALLLGQLSVAGLGTHAALGLSRLGSGAGYREILLKIKTFDKSRRCPPLLLKALVGLAGHPDFDVEAVEGLLLGRAADPRRPAALRQAAVMALGELGRRRPERAAEVRARLRSLSKDQVLASALGLTLGAPAKPAPSPRPAPPAPR